MEEICNYLLGHKQVIDFIHGHGPTGKACFVMFDERTEELAADAGLEVIHPTAKLRGRLDSKIVTTKIGNRARVPSVPNVLARADSYADLKKLAADAGLGDRLVVQTPYGDSGVRPIHQLERRLGQTLQSDGRTRAQSDETHSTAGGVRGGGHHKVRNAGGTIRRLTRWLSRVDAVCGRLVRERHLSGGAHRKAAKEGVQDDATAGRRTREEGYKGFFEVDYLVDVDTGELYLGELNPRVSGLSPITHVTLAAYADMPLFLFHLLEYLDVDYVIDVDEINERWSRLAADDEWSQLIIKETDDRVELLTRAPRTGIWHLDENGQFRFRRWAHDWHSIIDESEAFYLRVAAPGDYRYKGADLGVLVTRGRMQTDDHRLTERCHTWIDGIKSHYAGKAVSTEEDRPPLDPFAFKLG